MYRYPRDRTGATAITFDLSLLVFFALVFVAAFSGYFFPPGEWYKTLRKPPWTPPNWLFGPVWSVLYILIALSGWMIWRTPGHAPLALALWGAQLLVNAAWSWLFFGRRRIDLGMADVSLLWLVVAAYILAAWPVSHAAALLFAPYLLWVTIAATLNASVWRLNRQTLASGN